MSTKNVKSKKTKDIRTKKVKMNSVYNTCEFQEGKDLKCKEKNTEVEIKTNKSDLGVKKIKRKRMDVSFLENQRKKDKKVSDDSSKSAGCENQEKSISNDSFSESKKYVVKLKKNGRKEKDIYRTHRNCMEVRESRDYFTVKYVNKAKAMLDLKNEKIDVFIGNKVVVSNFSYKETEKSIEDCFKKFGDIENIQLQRNSENNFIGKAVITYKGYINIREEIVLNNKVLRVERIKSKVFNDKRIFISRINRNLSLLEIRNIFKLNSIKSSDIRIRYLENHQNLGYGHITFKNRLDAVEFEKKFNKMKPQLGDNCFYEYSVEKKDSNKVKRKR